MKFLIAIFTVLTLSFASAEEGKQTSSFSPSPSQDKSVSSIGLYLRNGCWQDVYVITRTLDYNGVLQSRGYYRIYPGETIYNATMSINVYYLHATTYDGSIRWEGPHYIELEGRYFRARLVELPGSASGDWTTTLTCN